MKKLQSVVTKLALTSPLRTLASVALISTVTSTHAAIIAGESFSGYISTSNFAGQAATGTGFTGNWAGSQYYRTQDSGLAMNGVYSTGGALYYATSTAAGNGTRTAVAAFSSPLSAETTYYGSYLFTYTSSGAQPRTLGGIGLGGTSDNDNTASYVWAGNGYNTQASPVVEGGPGIRAEGSTWQVPGITLAMNQTYLMLFQFDASAGTTSAWVLNEAQLANFSGSLNAATLNAATMNTESPTGIAWGGSVTSAGAIGSLSNLIMFGNLSTDGTFHYTWDEIRISNTNLTEAVTAAAVPEPSTIAALGFGLGALALRNTLRRRRTS